MCWLVFIAGVVVSIQVKREINPTQIYYSCFQVMDIAEQVPLQIHTPPKEDEDDVPEVIDNPPVVADETPVITSESYDTAEAFEAHEPEELEEQMEEGEEVFEEESSGDIVMEAEQSREDEIVVEPDDGEHERNGQNGIASPLSSPPESEIASPASKTGMFCSDSSLIYRGESRDPCTQI